MSRIKKEAKLKNIDSKINDLQIDLKKEEQNRKELTKKINSLNANINANEKKIVELYTVANSNAYTEKVRRGAKNQIRTLFDSNKVNYREVNALSEEKSPGQACACSKRCRL